MPYAVLTYATQQRRLFRAVLRTRMLYAGAEIPWCRLLSVDSKCYAYEYRVWYYGMRGTELAYGGMSRG
eukprot:944544-Rhodomonas_salina.1